MLKYFTLLITLIISSHSMAAERIVSVDGALTEIIYLLGKQEQLVATDTTSTFPKAAAQLPKVGYKRALSAEGILSLKPGLLITSDDAGPPTVLAQLKNTGVQIENITTSYNVASVKNKITQLGKLLNNDEQASKLTALLEEQHKTLKSSISSSKLQPKVMFILNHGGGSPMVAGTNTAADGIISLSGAINVAQSYEGYKPFTPEAAARYAPDIILMTNQGLQAYDGVEKLVTSPGISLTPAAKHKRIIALDSLYMLGFGPRIVEAASELHDHYKKLL